MAKKMMTMHKATHTITITRPTGTLESSLEACGAEDDFSVCGFVFERKSN
jgi:hypothetical protein